MSEGEAIQGVIREINRGPLMGPSGQSKEVRFYSENDRKPLKGFKYRKILFTFKNHYVKSGL